jgi:hypothetical protein
MNTRRLFLIAVICLFLTPVTGRAQNGVGGKPPANTAEADQAEVLRLEEAGRLKVIKGDNNWDDFIAEGAYMIGPDGKVVGYEKGKGFPPFPIKNFTLSEMIARSYGAVVVVTGLGEITAETQDKKTIGFQMRFINVWRRFPEGWKMVVTERTSVKDSIRPPTN